MRYAFLFCCLVAVLQGYAQGADTIEPAQLASLHICHIDSQLRQITTDGFYISVTGGHLAQTGTTDSSFIYQCNNDVLEVRQKNGARLFLMLTRKGVAVRTPDTTFLLPYKWHTKRDANLPRSGSGEITLPVGAFAIRLGLTDSRIATMELPMEALLITVHLFRRHPVTNRGAFTWMVSCQDVATHSYVFTSVARTHRSAAVMNATDSVGVLLESDRQGAVRYLYGTRIIRRQAFWYDDAHYAIRYSDQGEVVEHKGFQIGCPAHKKEQSH